MRTIKSFWPKKSAMLVAVLLIASFSNAYAQYSSGSYKVEEATFGTGGELDTSSASYRAQGAAGVLGVGDASSASYDATAGLITPNQEYLELNVENVTINLGELDPTTTKFGAAQGGVCNCSFFVRTYLSDQYVVTTMSEPPTSEAGVILAAKTTLGIPSSSDAVEEFGIRLVANTSPGSMGANPVNVPDGTFADGKAETGYDTVNQYKYNKGDIIARSAATSSNQATGQTNYTISYIVKSKTTTPAGLYSMSHDIVATALY